MGVAIDTVCNRVLPFVTSDWLSDILTLLCDVEKTVCKLPPDVTLGATYPKLFSHVLHMVVSNPSLPPLPSVDVPLPASWVLSPLSISSSFGPPSSGSGLSPQTDAGDTVSLTVPASSQSKCVLSTQAAKCKAITSSLKLELSDLLSTVPYKVSKVRAIVGSGPI